MDSKKRFLIFIPLFAFFFASCDSTDPGQKDSPETYVFLRVGDKRQMKRKMDGFVYYETQEVTGKTKRSDGLEIFIMTHSNNFSDLTMEDYYFIRDGFYYKTLLDSNEYWTSVGNPFAETKLAIVNPASGDSWYGGDQDTLLITTQFIDKKITPAGEFHKVVAFCGYSNIYYAADYGWIGIDRDNNELASVVYVKSGDKEMGQLVPSTVSNKKIEKPEAEKLKMNFF